MSALDAQVPWMELTYPVTLLLMFAASMTLVSKTRTWTTSTMAVAAFLSLVCFGLTQFPGLFYPLDAGASGEPSNVYFFAYSVLPIYLNLMFAIGLLGYAILQRNSK